MGFFTTTSLKLRISTLDVDLAAAKAELRAAIDGAHAASETLGALARERDDARARAWGAIVAFRLAPGAWWLDPLLTVLGIVILLGQGLMMDRRRMAPALAPR